MIEDAGHAKPSRFALPRLRRTSTHGAAVVLTLSFAGAPLQAEVEFVEVTNERGIGSYTMMAGMGGGVAAADYDGDGDIDLFVPTGHLMPDLLYRNLGNGSFEEIGAAAGFTEVTHHRTAVWFDYDGDDDLDLVITGCDAWLTCGPLKPQVRLFEQVADSMFEDVTEASGLVMDTSSPGPHISGICAGDINHDGWLDLMLGVWEGIPALFINNGDGTFTDVSLSSGVAAMTHVWQPMMHDFNGDGWQDISVTIDFAANNLWINQQDGTFIDVAPAAGADNAMNDMGQSLGDYDNDGDLDIYITNVFDYKKMDERNVLLRNDSVEGELAFTDVSVETGTDWGGWGWGTTFFDADRDGWLDIAATNGWGHEPWLTDQSRFYRNLGESPVAFEDLSAEVGFDDSFWGSGLVAADLNRDGDLDLIQACAFDRVRVLENEPGAAAAANHYLVVKPRMTGPNRRAIGAVVRVEAGDLTMTRLISAGTSLLSQEPAEAFFGLGSATLADVSITWPDGSSTSWFDVTVDRVLTLYAGGACSDINMDGDVGLEDLLVLLSSFGSCPAECPADLDGSGSVDFADLLILLSHWNWSAPCST